MRPKVGLFTAAVHRRALAQRSRPRAMVREGTDREIDIGRLSFLRTPPVTSYEARAVARPWQSIARRNDVNTSNATCFSLANTRFACYTHPTARRSDELGGGGGAGGAVI